MITKNLVTGKVFVFACSIIAALFVLSMFVSVDGSGDSNSDYRVDLMCDDPVHQVSQEFATLYFIDVVNLGENDDTILFSIGGRDYGMNGIDIKLFGENGYEIEQVSLESGEETTVILLVQSLEEINENITIEIAVKGESENNSEMWDAVVTTTEVRIENEYGVELMPEKAERKVREGYPAYYRIRITNTGNVEDTYNFKIAGKDYDPGDPNMEVKLFFPWKYKITAQYIGDIPNKNGTVTLPPGKSMCFYMRVLIKDMDDTNEFVTYHINVTAISKSDDEVTDTTETWTHVYPKPQYKIELECKDYVHKTVYEIPTYYFITLTNKGDAVDFVRVWYEHDYGNYVKAELYRMRYYHIDDEKLEERPLIVDDNDEPIFYDDSDYYDKMNDKLWIVLRPGQTARLLLKVTVYPEKEPANKWYKVDVVAKGLGNQARIKTWTYVVDPIYDFTFTCENTKQKTTYGESVLYRMELKNTGNVQDTIGLKLTGEHLNLEGVYARMIIYWPVEPINESHEIYFKDMNDYYYLPYQDEYISEFCHDEIKVTLQPGQKVIVMLRVTIYYHFGEYEVGIFAHSCTVKHGETVLTYTKIVPATIDIELSCDDPEHYTSMNVPTNYRMTIKNTGTISVVAKIWLAGDDYGNEYVDAKLFYWNILEPKKIYKTDGGLVKTLGMANYTEITGEFTEIDRYYIDYDSLEISLLPGEEKDFTLYVKVNANSGTYNIDVCATPYRNIEKDNDKSVNSTKEYENSIICERVKTYTHIIHNPNYGVEVTCKDNKHKIKQGQTTNYIIKVRNLGNVQNTFRVFVGKDSELEKVTAELFYILHVEPYPVPNSVKNANGVINNSIGEYIDKEPYYLKGYESLNVTLEPNEAIKLLLRVKVDYDSGEYEVTVTAESLISTGVKPIKDTVSTYTTVVSEIEHGVILWCHQTEQKVARNQPARYYMIVQNTGNVPDFIRLTLHGDALGLEGVTAYLYFPKVKEDEGYLKEEDILIRDSNDTYYMSIKYETKIKIDINKGISIYLPSGGRALVILKVIIDYPDGSYEIEVKARSIGDPTKTDSVKTVTHIIEEVESNIDLECFNPEITTVKEVPANYIIRVTNKGKQRDVVILTPGGRHYGLKGVKIELFLLNFVLPSGEKVEEEHIIEVGGNTSIASEYLTEIDGDEIKVELNPGESVYVLMRVTIRYNEAMTYEITLTGESTNTPGMKDTVVTKTTIIPLPEYGVKLYCPNPSHYVVYNRPTNYYITVKNTGNVYDIIYLSLFGDYTDPNVRVNFFVPKLMDKEDNLVVVDENNISMDNIKYIRLEDNAEEIQVNVPNNKGFGIGLKGGEKRLLILRVTIFKDETGVTYKKTYNIGVSAVSICDPSKKDKLVTRTTVFDKKISEAIDNGKISAIFYVHEKNGTDEVFEEGMSIKAKLIESNKMHFEVSANFSKGRVVIIDVDNEQIDELGNYTVLFDGVSIELEELDNVLGANGSKAVYAVITGDNTTQVLVWIPYFSTHTISIETLTKEIEIPLLTDKDSEEKNNYWLIGLIALPIGLMVGYTYGWKRKSKGSVFKEFKLGTITEEKKTEQPEEDWEKFLDLPEFKK